MGTRGIFLVLGNAGFISSTVSPLKEPKSRRSALSVPVPSALRSSGCLRLDRALRCVRVLCGFGGLGCPRFFGGFWALGV